MSRKITAAYIRISQKDNDLKIDHGKEESNSVMNQRKYIQDFISKHDFPAEKLYEFVDDGYSGTNFNRPKFRELLSLCKQGQVGCIIVKDFSRFGRNYIELGDYLEQLFPFLGIRFISINDQYDSSSFEGTTGGIDVAFQNLVYELYSRDLSKKTYSAVGNHMKKGTYLPGSALFGYQNDHEKKTLVPDKEAAEIVKRIFTGVVGGKSTVQVAKELNDDDVPLPLDYKKKNGEYLNRNYAEIPQWTVQKVLRIIKNEKYMGTMVYRTHRSIAVGSGIRRKQDEENWIRIENHHEPIIERELFEKANANLRKVKAGKRKLSEGKSVC